jgi:signal transduction histidine kinase
LRTNTVARVGWLWCLAMTMASAGSGAAEPSAIKRVLVLHHYGQEIPMRATFDPAVQEALRDRSAGPLEIHFEAIESYRFPDAPRSGVVKEYLKAKYDRRKPDVIIAVTDTALAFLRRNPDVFPEVPIVTIVTRESLEAGASDVTGLQQQVAIRDTLAFALNLEPATERVFVVDGALYNSGDIEAEVRRQVEALDRRLDLVYLRNLPMVELIARIEAIPDRSILLFVRQVMWDRATPLDLREGIRRVAQASPVPTFALTSAMIGMGPVGGYVVHWGPDAVRLAEMAIRILNGESPRDIPPGNATIAATVDWRQLRRWKIPEARLPAGTIVLFRETSVWERHRVAIAVGSGVLLLQSLLIAGLVFEHRRRRQAEIDARRHLASMAHLDRRAAMGELATSLAHELNQPLNAILQNAGVAQMLLASGTVPPALAEMADIITDIRNDDIRASEVIRRMRGLLQKHELEARPVDLNAVAQDTVAIVQPEARAREIPVELDLADDLRPILGDRVHLQQVLLNLLLNAADAVTPMPPERRRVRVWTRARDGEVRLAVSDTGVGIPAEHLARIFEPFYTTKCEGSGMGMGLAIARSIVEAHAGRMGAESNAGTGATVWVSLPASAGPPS